MALLSSCATSWVNEPQDDPRTEEEEALAEWKEARKQGRNGQAARLRLERLVLKYPNDAPLLVAAATVAYEGGDHFRALGYADKALQLDPFSVPASVLRARFAMEAGNLSFARRFLDDQLERIPEAHQLHESRAAVLYLEEKLEDSARSLKRAEALGAPAWRVAFHRGLLFEAAGKTEEAKAAYERTLALRPTDERARSRLRGLSAETP